MSSVIRFFLSNQLSLSVSLLTLIAIASPEYFASKDAPVEAALDGTETGSTLPRREEVQRALQEFSPAASSPEIVALRALAAYSETKSISALTTACNAIGEGSSSELKKIESVICAAAKDPTKAAALPEIGIANDTYRSVGIVSESTQSLNAFPEETAANLSLLAAASSWINGQTEPFVCSSSVPLKPRALPVAADTTTSDLYTERGANVLSVAEKLATPKDIFFYVRDQIEFMPRFGLTQTPEQTLISRMGSAADKAALLIAILRSKNIPAKFIAGTILVPETKLKQLYGVDETWDLAWAHAIALRGYFFGPNAPSPDRPNTVFLISGKRYWLMPHVWVYAKIDDLWRQLDPIAANANFIDSRPLLDSNPLSTGLEAYLFQATSAGDYLKDETLLDSLMRKAPESLRSTFGTLKSPTYSVGKIDIGDTVRERELTITLGEIGYGAPCVAHLGVSLPEAYEYRSRIKVESEAGAVTLSADLPLARARQDVLHLIHSNGLKYEGATGAGQLALKLGTDLIASGASAIGDNVKVTHEIAEPSAYGALSEKRTVEDIVVGGAQVFFHHVAPVREHDLELEVDRLIALKASGTANIALLPHALRISAIYAAVKSSEFDRDLRILRGVRNFSKDLILAMSLEGRMLADQTVDLGTIPLGSIFDWKMAGLTYATSGNHENLSDYTHVTQAKVEALVSGSEIEAQVWKDLYKMSGFSASVALQRLALQNYLIDQGLPPTIPGEGPATQVSTVNAASLASTEIETTLNLLGPGMRRHESLLRSYSEEAALIYGGSDTLKFPEGWKGEAFFVLPTQPLGRGGSYIAVTGRQALLGWILSAQNLPHYGQIQCWKVLPPGSSSAVTCDSVVAQINSGGGGAVITQMTCGLNGYEDYCSFRYDAYLYYEDPAIGMPRLPDGIPPYTNSGPKEPEVGGYPPPNQYDGRGTDTLTGTANNTTGSPGGACGQPVNLSNGKMWHQFVDFSYDGQAPGTRIELKRTYLTDSVSGFTHFGPHWWSSWDTQIQVTGEAPYLTDLVWIDEDGGPWVYKASPSGYVTPPGQSARLTRDNGQFVIIKPDGVRLIYGSAFPEPVGKLLGIVDPHGPSLYFSYNSNGTIKYVQEPKIGRLTVTVNTQGRITKILSERDQVDYEYGYDQTDRLIYSRDVDNNETHYEYVTSRPGTNAQGLLSAIEDPLHRRIEFSYYDNGKSYSQTEYGGAKRTFIYGDRKTRVTDLEGNVMEFRFDEMGRLVETVHPDGSRNQNAWSENNRIVESTDELGFKTAFTYDTRGNITGIKQPVDPAFSTLEYDPAFNRVTRMVPLAGSETRFSISSTNGDLLAVSRDDAQGAVTTTYTRDSVGNIASGATGLYSYTNSPLNPGWFGRLTYDRSTYNPSYQLYDTRGRLTNWRAFNSGHERAFTYDNRDRVIRITDNRAPTREFEYDVMSRLKKLTVTDGTSPQVTEYSYDDRDRLISVKDPSGRLTQYEYDAVKLGCNTRDQVARKILPDGRMFRYEYDERQRLIREQNPQGGITRYEYTDRGEVSAITDPEGKRTRFYYDGNRRLVRRESPSVATNASTGVTASALSVSDYFYDAAGRLIRTEEYGGGTGVKHVTELTYDGLDRVVRRVLKKVKGRTILEVQDDSSFTYARILDKTRLTQASNGVAKLTFEYKSSPELPMQKFIQEEANTNSPAGVLTRTILFSGLDPFGTPNAFEYTLNGQNRAWNGAISVAGDRFESMYLGASTGSGYTMFTYDGFARVKTVYATTSGLMRTYSYDSLNRIGAVTHTGSDGTQAQALSQAIVYGALSGNIDRITREFGETNYSHDGTDQLLGASYAGTNAVYGGLNRSQTYDYSGNRLTDSILGNSVYINHAITQDSLSLYTYDPEARGQRTGVKNLADGSTREKMGYRIDGLLKSYENSNLKAEYLFDPLGRRAVKRVTLADGTSFNQSYLYDRDSNRVLIAKAGNGSEYFYLHDSFHGQVLGEQTTAGYKPYALDHLGSVINDLPAGPAKAFESFGGSLSALPALSLNSKPVLFGFAGMRLDQESGLYHTRYRQFDPRTATWTSRDPIGFEGKDLNLNRYVGNNSLLLRDPLGLVARTLYDSGGAGPSVRNACGLAILAGITLDIWKNSNTDPDTNKDSEAGGDTDREESKHPAIPDFWNPEVAPGKDWEWRGSGPPSSGKGNWHNPKTGESLHPDLKHPLPKGPHWDYHSGKGGPTTPIYPPKR